MVVVAAGARITGTLGFDEFGAGLAGGDFNGDGIADLAIHYRLNGSSRATSSSTIQIIYGGADVFDGDLAAQDLAGGDITTSGVLDIGVGINVPGALEFADVNGDGLSDLLIGSPRVQYSDNTTGGAAHILFGIAGDAGFSFTQENLANGVNGQTFFATGGRNTGSSFVSLGDIDNDDVDELFIGSPFADGTSGQSLSGLGFVIERGNAGVTDLADALGATPTINATVLFGESRTFLAEDAANVGDVDGDGIADFVVSGRGAIGAGTGQFSVNSGELYLIYGNAAGLPDQINVSELDGTTGSVLIGSDAFNLDGRVAAAGDVNGDGLADFIVEDVSLNTETSGFFLVYGNEAGLGATFDVSTQSADRVTQLGYVPSVSVSSGKEATGVGDVNGDGYDDLLIGRAAGGQNGLGEIALLFGSAAGFGATVDLDDLAPGAGYRFVAQEGDFRAGFAVSRTGDVNGDGIDDFVIGVPFHNPDSNADFNVNAPGAAYVVLGGADRLAALDDLSGTDGLITLGDVVKDINIPGDTDIVTYSLGADFTIAEENGANTTFAITVTRSDSAGAAEIDLAISGAVDVFNATADLTRIGGSNVFADGETQITAIYRVVDDTRLEGSEQAIFDLSIVSAEGDTQIGDGRQIVTIADDDAPTVFGLGQDFTVSERNGQDTIFSFTVTRSDGTGAAEIDLAFSGTANADNPTVDFDRIGGTNTFADGETEKQIFFRLVDDSIDEPNETIVVDLSVVASDRPAEIGSGQQTITIIDDDEPVTYSLGNDFSVLETDGPNNTFGILVTRSDGTGTAEIDLGISGTATSQDFDRIGGSNVFADGETEKLIAFRVTNDALLEGPEDIVFDLSLVAADIPGQVTDGQQIITIEDDEAPVTFNLGPDTTVFEENGITTLVTLFVTRSSGAGAASFDLNLSGSAATTGPDTDIQLVLGDMIFADGETSAALTFLVTDDAIDEPDEELVITFSQISSHGVPVIDNDTQIITIRDDDLPGPIFGTNGNDTLLAGPNNNQVRGRDGNDTITGSDGDDTIFGGAGRDSIAGRGGNDSLYGENGHDSIFGGTGNDRVFGQDGNDWLGGGDGSDRIGGGDGNDQIYGGDARDLVTGGAGNDTLFGGNGDDRLYGGSGDDSILGIAGADVIYGGTGRDRVLGGEGNDTIAGGDGSDAISGGDGRDTLSGDDWHDSLYGGFGRDTVFGGDGFDLIRGGDDGDRLFGGASRDTLYGGDGGDTVFGGSGSDSILGEAGNDFLIGGSGDDRLTGGFGQDQVFGGSGNDAMAGGSNHDILRGGDGNDRMYGGSGNDTISGETGSDLMRGGTGDDRIIGGRADDMLFGDFGNDILFGGWGRDLLEGGDGNDRMSGSYGDDTLTGGDGNDAMTGGSGNDVMQGNEGRDLMFGGSGQDRLVGGRDQDTLIGGAGADMLFGGSGQNRLQGGDGDDLMIGGGGRDFFIFDRDDGSDRIIGFQNIVDKIQIDTGAARFDQLDITRDGQNAVVSFGDTEITLVRFDEAQLNANDFIFA